MALTPGSRKRDYDLEPGKNRRGPKFVNPHSPWQLFIEARREEKQMSMRDLATRAQIPSGTIFNWLRSQRGYPMRTQYTSAVNARFARALGVKPERLAQAYNESTAVNSLDPHEPDKAPRPAPQNLQETPPGTSVDSLRRFVAMVKLSGKSSLSIAEIEALACMILNPDSKD